MIFDTAASSTTSEIDLTREEEIDSQDPGYRQVFENLQGNILKAYKRDFTDLHLITFTARASKVREWIRDLAESSLTSAGEQLREDRLPEEAKRELFGSFYLTAVGYQALGISWNEIASRFNGQGQIARFVDGMAAAGADLNDPPATGWEPPYAYPRMVPIHAMILFASNSREALDKRKTALDESLQGVGCVIRRERGAVLWNKDKTYRIEPFGFADGGSQPFFLKREPGNQAPPKSRDSTWKPAAPLSLALVRDPFADRNDAFSSYLVYRKLAQDVVGFQKRIHDLADTLKVEEPLAEAMVMGRFKDGTPLALYDRGGQGSWDSNDFDYLQDSAGLRCPFHSHIRRANPRTEDARERRIVRRGVAYQENGEQGLLFLCFQSKIHDQFAYIHRQWANVDFPYAGTGIDPLIGRPGFQQYAHQQWSTKWGEKPDTYFDFSGFVTLKGGEFFFAPSLPFLLSLKA
jgi:Dyp-type peroxidase family